MIFYSVWKLVRFRDTFQELDLSSICFLQIFFHSYKQFFQLEWNNFFIWKSELFYLIVFIYEVSAGNFFHVNDIILYLHAPWYHWCEHGDQFWQHKHKINLTAEVKEYIYFF